MIAVRHVGATLIADLVRSQPLTPAKVRFAWQQAAGPALARATAATLEADGTLEVHAASPAWAREVDRSRGLLLGRLVVLLGSENVKRLAVRESA